MFDILQLPGWRVSAMGQEGTHLVIEATYTQADEACHKCGSIGVLYKHGTKVVRFRDIPVRMMPTVIDGTVQRYRCRDCGETFVQTPDGIDDTRRMTERCVEFIKQQCIPHTFTHIAELVGCVEGTVRAIAAERFDEFDGNYLVRFQHDFGNGEALDATISVPRGNHTLGSISQLALDRLAELIAHIRPAA